MDFKIRRLATINYTDEKYCTGFLIQTGTSSKCSLFYLRVKAAITAKFCVKVEASQSYR